MSKMCGKMFITISQSQIWHLHIVSWVPPTVQNPQTLHLLPQMAKKKNRCINQTIVNRSIMVPVWVEVLCTCIHCSLSLLILRCAPQPTHQRRPPTSRMHWPCSPGWRRPRASTAAAVAVPWRPPWPPHPRPPRSAAGGSHQTYLMCRNLHRDSGLRGNPPCSPAPPGPQAWTPTRALSRRLA